MPAKFRKRHNVDIKKAAVLSIVLNVLQIAAVLGLVVMVFTSRRRDISPEAEQWVVLMGAVLVLSLIHI